MSTASITAPEQITSREEGRAEARLPRLRYAIDHAAHLLPTQGPITVFIHHNTLHAFEDLPFDEAVVKAGRMFGCEPYLPEQRYRDAYAKGRIRFSDLDAILTRDLGSHAEERILDLCGRYELRMAMLRHPLQSGPAAELRWFVAETDALRQIRTDVPSFVRERLIADTRRWVMNDVCSGNDGGAAPRNDGVREQLSELFDHFGEPSNEGWNEHTWEQFTLQALWRICRDGVRGLKANAKSEQPPVRHRDLLLDVCHVDIDPMVNDILIRFTAAYLDQGFARWSLPDREQGYYQSFCEIYREPGGPPDPWLRDLPHELARLQDSGTGPLESVAESLARLGVAEEEWESFLTPTLLSLRGWGGMLVQIETRGDKVPQPIHRDSLIGFLAVRLILERLALEYTARTELGYEGPLDTLRTALRSHESRRARPSVDEQAFLVFQIAQLIGWSPGVLRALNSSEWSELVDEIGAFSNVERRRIFHAAYERRYFNQTFDALSIYRGRESRTVPRFQVVCCIDDREESFRRHLEELSPEVETLGTAGFYGVAMFYRGAADAHFVPLCPAVVTPNHWIREQVVDESEGHHRRARIRRAIGAVTLWTHVGSRTFGWGALLSAGVGVFAAIPLISRVLFPRLAARARRRFGGYVQPSPRTRLTLERTSSQPGSNGDQLGYSLDEMIDVAEKVLRELGLTEQTFARLVLILGHGSHSMNNPHEAAHDCGACGGAVGGPNGRAFAQICNDPRIRERLAARGLRIPKETVFVGGLHNTCNEYVKLYDTDRVPESHRRELDEVRKLCERALDRDAHERARRFESAPLSISFDGARRHMDARAEDLAQVRPEWGHATNAITIVGRRSRTRGLFFDRRAFLTSYDPTQDDAEATILARTLSAVVPVCAGIGLEYYFSNVDPYGYGCNTKLPHNITALLGVMDGASSDLRTGLPWQMVEIHEPLRQLFVIETTPEAMRTVMERNASIDRLCRNEWIYLALLSPDSSEIQVFREGQFHRYRPETTELPKARTSIDWYRGWRDYLGIAEIEA